MKKSLLLFFFAQLFIAFHINAQIIKHTSTSVSLRAAPDTYSEKVITIPAGTEIELSRDYNKEWIPIEFNGKTLYLYSDYLVSGDPKILRATSSISNQNHSKKITDIIKILKGKKLGGRLEPTLLRAELLPNVEMEPTVLVEVDGALALITEV